MTAFSMITLILLPLTGGVLELSLKKASGRIHLLILHLCLGLEFLLTLPVIFSEAHELTLFSMTDALVIRLRADSVSKLFMGIAAAGFLLAGIYAPKYFAHETEEDSFPDRQFYGFFLFSAAALMGMDMASNLVTLYFFFETVTLLSMPLVLHERTKEAVSAAMKYLFYSMAGAFLALLAIFILSRYSSTLEFTPGGSLLPEAANEHRTLLSVVLLLAVLGFGAKAGLYPLHGWLPSAHPAAPAPASAVLSGIIAKAGVLAILRLLYFSAGTAFLSGGWVQTVLLSVSLFTVFMGSMMAFREKVLKKRLAYSTISQISYILFGLFLFNETAFTGAMEQLLYHACVKICLFLIAGAFIVLLGVRRVDELRGCGKVLPFTLGAFTLASLSLIGIPPFAGFLSKWYLAQGALSSGIALFSWLGPVVLLVSALLTAGYLLPITIAGFFPGEDFVSSFPEHKREGGLSMLLPTGLLAVLALLFGLFGDRIDTMIRMITETVF